LSFKSVFCDFSSVGRILELDCEEVVRRVFLLIFPQLDFFLGFLAWQHVKSDFVGRHEKISFSGDGG
jgi:hypothetical protein